MTYNTPHQITQAITSDNILSALSRCPLFRNFSLAELTDIVPLLSPQERHLSAGEILVHAGENAEQIGMVLSGSLMYSRFNALEIEKSVPELFGLVALFSETHKSHITISASSNTSVLLFDIRPLMDDIRYADRIKDTILQAIATENVRDILTLDTLMSYNL